MFLLVTEPLQPCDLPSPLPPPVVPFPESAFAPELVFPPSVPDAQFEFDEPLLEAPPDVPLEAPPDVPPEPDEPEPAAIADVAMPIVTAETARIFKNIFFSFGFAFQQREDKRF